MPFLKHLVSFISLPLLLFNMIWFSAADTATPIALDRVMLSFCAENIKLSAHRGFNAVAPENTLPAFEEAGKAGFYAAEFDIHETKDGYWIVNHDDTVDAMTNGTGRIAEKTLKQLRALTVDSGANIADYPGLRLPTLEEALDTCKANGIRPEIEIKAGSAAALGRLADTLRKRGMLGDAIVISFSHGILKQLYALEPTVEYWFLCNELSDAALALARQTPDFRVAFNGTDTQNNTALRIWKFRQEGFELAMWTVDAPATLWWYYPLGIRYITTNRIQP